MSAAEQKAPTAADGEPPRFRFRFRIVHIIYVVTLLAASLATFGQAGIAVFVIVAAFWGAVFASRARAITFVELCTVLLVCCCLISLLLPAVSSSRSMARRMQCSNNLKQIALALHNYHDVHGSFPPAYIADENGKPMHSWRVLLLPYLEQEPLYKRYKFDEPWDGPNNSKLLKEMPLVYACPSHVHGGPPKNLHTSYVAVVGPQTAWPGATARKLSDLRDGLSNTLLIAEHHNHSIAWLRPDDLTLDGALLVLTDQDFSQAGGHKYETFFYRYYVGRNVALADGSVRNVVNDADRRTWVAMLSTGDQMTWDDFELRQPPRAQRYSRELRVGNCVRLAIWVVVVLFPLPWVWLKPKTTATTNAHSPALVQRQS